MPHLVGLALPGSTFGQQDGVVHKHSDCVQEESEPAQVPPEAQVLQCMQQDAPNVLSVYCG